MTKIFLISFFYSLVSYGMAPLSDVSSIAKSGDITEMLLELRSNAPNQNYDNLIIDYFLQMDDPDTSEVSSHFPYVSTVRNSIPENHRHPKDFVVIFPSQITEEGRVTSAFMEFATGQKTLAKAVRSHHEIIITYFDGSALQAMTVAYSHALRTTYSRNSISDLVARIRARCASVFQTF